MRAAHALAALGAAFVLLYAGFVLGQQSAPNDYKLVSEDVLAKIDLGCGPINRIPKPRIF